MLLWGPSGTVPWLEMGGQSQLSCLQPGEVVQNSPGAGSLFPTLLSVAVAVGREEGRGDLGGGGDPREGVAWPLRQPVSVSNMWSVAMVMPFDVASGRRWERWQR